MTSSAEDPIPGPSEEIQPDDSTPLLGGRRRGLTSKAWAVYLAFLTLGLGTLLPWNFFITAESYWQYKFRNTTANLTATPIPPRTQLQDIYTPLLVVFSQVTNFTFLVINALYSNKLSLQKRLVGSLSVMLAFFMVTTAFVKVDTDSWPVGFFIVTMTIVVFLNCSGALFQGSLFGLAGMFPPQYTTAVVTGQAIGGVFASLARIVSLAAGADDITSAFIFFSIAVAVMLLTLGALFFLFKTELYRQHTSSRVEDRDLKEAPLEETQPLGRQEVSVMGEFKRVFLEIWLLSASVFFVFFITLAMFPAVCVHISSSSPSADSSWSSLYFQPVMTFLLFNVSDYLGRQLGGFFMLPKKGSKLLYLLVTSRLVFLPLLMLCNHPSSPSPIPSVFTSDYAYFFIMLAFGCSNGYLGTLCMIYGPSSISDPQDAEKAGNIMAASLGAGLLAGGMASFGFGSLYF